MNKMAILILPFFGVFLIGSAEGSDPDTTSSGPSAGIYGFPFAFFIPETGWGFGAAGIYSFQFDGSGYSPEPSRFQVSAAYTLKNQLLIYLPYEFYLADSRYRIYGEAGYYRYSYPFFGIGNKSAAADEEIYRANFPRLILTGVRRVAPNMYAGLRYWYDFYDIAETETGGLLDRGDITGQNGGVNSGLAFVVNYDSRDHVYLPSRGVFTEVILHADRTWLGSDFDFFRGSVDLRAFITNRYNHTLGFNLYGTFSGGEVPFQRLPMVGGPQRMRGYIEGRYRDSHYLTVQSEYRFPVYGRFGMVMFGTAGEVFSTAGDIVFRDLKWSAGAGLRFLLDPENRINIRLDYGLTRESGALYLTFTEPF